MIPVRLLHVGSAVLLGLALALLPSCRTTLTGRSSLALIGESETNQMGAESYQQLLSQPGMSLVRSGADWQTVDRISRRIVEVAKEHEPSFAWEWNVIQDDRTVNAFCLPGGKIAVYTGIIRLAGSDDELAAVIGHEIAHATCHHGQKRVSQQMAEGLVAEGVGTYLELPTDQQAMVQGALGMAVSTIDAYSRDDETESDIVGLKYLIDAGYDPNGAVRFWQRMLELSGPSQGNWMSTHPSNEKRIATLQHAIQLHKSGVEDWWMWEHYQ